MGADFNALVANVARASARHERAAGLVLEAQTAAADTAADLAEAELALSRAVAIECGMNPVQQTAPTPPMTVIPMTRAPEPQRFAFRRRCSFCRKQGHDLRNCPDIVAASG